MSLTLHFHPLSSFCHKALIALYENDTPFEPHIVNLMDPARRGGVQEALAVRQVSGAAGRATDRTIPESSIIIEYLDQHYPGKTRFIPADAERALQMRLQGSLLRPALASCTCRRSSATGCARTARRTRTASSEARTRMQVALDMIDAEMAGRTWAMGDEFTHGRLRGGAARCSTPTWSCRSRDTHKNAARISTACWSARPTRARSRRRSRISRCSRSKGRTTPARGPAPAGRRAGSPSVMSPPCERAMSRAMARPSPVPPSSWLRASSSRRNGLNTSSRMPAGMPARRRRR